MESKELSIAIATKGREEYCIKTIKSILPLINNSTEIVISDNSDSDTVEKYVKKIDDCHIIYRHTLGNITVADNYNIAFDLSSGNYVCMIGDDDAILPTIYAALSYAEQNGIDVITQNNVLNYIWPSDNNHDGVMYVSEFSKDIRDINPDTSLRQYLLRGASCNPRDYDLPAVYHGLVKRSVLQEMKRITGNYILAISPDSYTSAALSCVIKLQSKVYYPITIGGACRKSWTAQNMRKGYCGPLSSYNQCMLNFERGINWHPIIPEYYSVQTIWAESVLQALCRYGRNEMLQLFSLTELTSDALLNNRSFLSLIIKKTNENLKASGENILAFYALVSIKLFKGLVIKVLNRIGYRKHSMRTIENLGEIDEAIKIIVEQDFCNL